tara:strand:- start:351 stop:812 length:462 start_codon:yes stop_codon:yes gene_type:complete
MIKINIISRNKSWHNYFKSPKRYIKKKEKLLNKNFKKYKKKSIIFTLLLSNNAEIKKLNRKFRKKNKITDILSFPFYNKRTLDKKLVNEKEIYLGDVIVNLNEVKNKSNFNKFKLEFDKLWIHGLVHLFGYDHKNVKDYIKMIKVEKKFLSYV